MIVFTDRVILLRNAHNDEKNVKWRAMWLFNQEDRKSKETRNGIRRGGKGKRKRKKEGERKGDLPSEFAFSYFTSILLHVLFSQCQPRKVGIQKNKQLKHTRKIRTDFIQVNTTSH